MSQHPADRLIRALIASGRTATIDELQQIIDRIATAPFDTQTVPVPTRLRGLTYQGHVLGSRAASLTYHVMKRVLDDRQWARGTTAAQYLADLRRAVRASSARLAVYTRRGGAMAVAMASTETAVPASRRTRESLPHILVVFSADRGIMVTGYQVSGLEQTGIPEDARWLT